MEKAFANGMVVDSNVTAKDNSIMAVSDDGSEESRDIVRDDEAAAEEWRRENRQLVMMNECCRRYWFVSVARPLPRFLSPCWLRKSVLLVVLLVVGW